MRAHSLTAKELARIGKEGWIVAEDVRSPQGKRIIKKGAILDRSAFDALEQAGCGPIHVVEPDVDDLHEDEAGRRVAVAVAGDGVRIKGPALSRYNLIAERKGVLRINPGLIFAMNQVPGMSVFTLLDRQTVLPGKIVAGVKVTPLAVPKSDVERVESLVQEGGGSALGVVPFQHKRVAVIATEGLAPNLRQRFTDSVEQKVEWYGSTVTSLEFVPSELDAVAGAMRERLGLNEVILVAGGNTLDPLDPAYLAIGALGGRMIHYGAPSHPGSMFWLAEVGDVPVFNLATCSMYSSVTFADLILPLVMTGEHVSEEEIDQFGYGGLLEREMRFRFPPYDQEASGEADEEG